MSEDNNQQQDPENLAAKTQRRLAKAERQHERAKNRLKKLQLFEDHDYIDYKGDKKTLKKATRCAGDPPEIQMMIARRDRYEACVRLADEMHKSIAEMKDPDERVKALITLAKLEDMVNRHALAIEKMVCTANGGDNYVNHNRSTLLAKAADLAQKDRHHADRISLAKKDDPANVTNAHLLRIANGEEES